MRRSFFAVLVLSFSWAMVGCYSTHGVCDCDRDDHCAHRTPWVEYSATPAPVIAAPLPAATPAPAVLPR